MAVQHGAKRLAGDVFHDHPVIALGVGAQVVEADQVRVLEVEALGHAAQLDLEVAAAHQLEGHFLAAVADGVVHLAEAAAADAALQRVTVQRPLSRTVGELHRSTRQDCDFPEVYVSRRYGAVRNVNLGKIAYFLPSSVPTGSIAKAKSSPLTVEFGRSNPRSPQRWPSMATFPVWRTPSPPLCR